MHAFRIYRRVESEILQLPELRQFIGKNVEIVVLEEPSSDSTQPAEKRMFGALHGSRRKNLIDAEAYRELRAASMI